MYVVGVGKGALLGTVILQGGVSSRYFAVRFSPFIKKTNKRVG